MHPGLENLLAALRPERIGERRYQASQPGGMGTHLFGGQVLAQALAAAHLEQPEGDTHSLHACFLQRGNPVDPIQIEVVPLRHSRAFHTHRVTAHQEDKPILEMLVSHHLGEEGLEHQIPMDEVGEPEGEAYERGLLRAMSPGGFDDEDTPFELPVEIRGVGGLGLFSSDVRPPQARCWMRVRGELPDDPRLHQCLFAYASDYAIIAPAIHPHPMPVTAYQSASLDHAVWFHRRFRMDDWLLFELDSPIATGARGLGRGLLYTRAGRLVGSCAQEALLRPLRTSEG